MSRIGQTESFHETRDTLAHKRALRMFYEESYRKVRECLGRCPPEGQIVELGSGAGFAKTFLPRMRTSDIIAYPSLDLALDAVALPFRDQSLRMICLLNVFHHIPDSEVFLREAQRCLRMGGRLFMLDHYPGWIGGPIYRYLHHEPFDPSSKRWSFQSKGGAHEANGALAWIVFERDQHRFERLYPNLKLELYRRHSPLRYWLAGGLKAWSVLPGGLFGLMTRVDRLLLDLSPRFASFVDIELVKMADE